MFNHLLDALETPVYHQFSVDKHCRGSTNTGLCPISHISDNKPLYGSVFYVFIKSYHIETQLSGNLKDLGAIQGAMVFEQFIVKLPKFSLPIRCEGGRSSDSCKSVIGKRKILENQFDLSRISVQHLLEQRFEPRTGGSLVITEDGNGYRGIISTPKRKSGHTKFMDHFKLNNFQ